MDTERTDINDTENRPQDATPSPPSESEATPPEAAPEPAPEAQEKTVRIVAIKFRDAGKLYDFDARHLDLHHENQVVVETDRGKALGMVVLEPRDVPKAQAPENLKSVLRLANDKDLESAERHAAREAEALRYCRNRVAERKMEMKLVKAEYLFDGSKIIFYFTADGRIDFRELVKDLAHYFHTRIEMRQIGVRDEAKLIGGIGVCGRELCCCSFLREFEPVSVKMAKEQGLALNPSKISGQCGRLLCCLGYEYETYCSLKKGLPKCGRKVRLGEESVEVAQIDILRQQVTIRRDDRTEVVSADEIRAGTVEPPTADGAKPKTDKPAPSEGRRERPPRRPSRDQVQRKAKEPPPAKDPEERPAAPPEATDDGGERKKRRRPRRRRRGKRGGQGPEGGTTPPDKTQE